MIKLKPVFPTGSLNINMEASICRNCKLFFGCQEGLCSQCFKEFKIKGISEGDVTTVLNSIPKIIEEVKLASPVEAVPDKCFLCSKKLGPLHFKCKCSSFFCTKHRHPEEHHCSYDHKTAGIRKLSEENPLVQAPKFNKL